MVHTGSGYPSPYSPGKHDCLSFEVDKDISLLGVTFCGSKNCKYDVTLHVLHSNGPFVSVVCATGGKFSSVCIKSMLGSYYGFDVFFDSPVVIKRGVRYHLEASISGSANSCLGQNGQHSVVCSGVKFDFKNNEFSSNAGNGTTVKQGQFPGLLFIVN